MQFEDHWLSVLAKSTVPCAMIWGEKDPVAVTNVADYVWDNYLKNRETTATYDKIPEASHYL
jgi:pimeloyl-ACP methyl ester carboxylesterase